MCPRGSIGYANKTSEPFILLPNLLVVAEAIMMPFNHALISLLLALNYMSQLKMEILG
jgi:hypothetical protein